jgi:hypothetical protein
MFDERCARALLHQQTSEHGRAAGYCSNGKNEFGDDGQESMVRIEVEGQLVVSAAHVWTEPGRMIGA